MNARWARLVVPLGLGALTVVTRLPFASRTLYSFDSANYAFALRDYYNVAHHQPHPPGYPLYVAAAKAIDLVVREPNLSLVLLSILASAGAAALLVVLADLLCGRRVGLIAGLLLCSTVGFWGYGEVAYPYTCLAFWLVAGALLCLLVIQGRREYASYLGVALGLAAGFRWDAALFLIPLYFWALAYAGWTRRLLSLGLFGLVCVAWFVPMAWLSGGLSSYLEALRLQSAYIVGTYSLASGGRAILEFNLAFLVTFFRQMYGLEIVLILFALGRLVGPRRIVADLRVRFLLVWLLPALIVYFVVHIGEPGYLLSLAPALALLVGIALFELHIEMRLAAAILAARFSRPRIGRMLNRLAPVAVPLVVAGLVGWQAYAFLTSIGPARRPELALIDATQTAQIGYVRRQAAPGDAIVLAHDRFRQAQYYLTGYDVRLLFDEYAQGWLEGRVWSIEPPSGVRRLIVLDDLDPAVEGASGARVTLVDSPAVAVWDFDLNGVKRVDYGYRTLRLVR